MGTYNDAAPGLQFLRHIFNRDGVRTMSMPSESWLGKALECLGDFWIARCQGPCYRGMRTVPDILCWMGQVAHLRLLPVASLPHQESHPTQEACYFPLGGTCR